MNQKGTYIKHASGPSIWTNAILKPSFLLLLILLIVESSSSKGSYPIAEDNVVISSLSSNISDKQVSATNENFDILVFLEEFENSSENNHIDDDFDGNFNFNTATNIVKTIFSASSEKTNWLSLGFKQYNCTIPFFILYHSWKSYLS